MSVLDERILSIKFPEETTRKLRPTGDVSFWKASEFRIFLVVSPIVLKNLIDKHVYNHWLLLVHGITLLLGNEVTGNDLKEAELALKKFVFGVENIYGRAELSYNIHLLIHLPQAVRYWGPLWAHSCFLYEDSIGRLKRFHHGTRGEANQILTSYAMQSVLKLLVLQENVKNTRVKFYIQTRQQKLQCTEKNPKMDNCILLGLSKSVKLPRVHEIELLKLLTMNNKKSVPSVESYDRMLHCSKLYSTKHYGQKFLRANYVISTRNNVCFVINYIIVFNEEVFLIGGKLSTKQLKKSVSAIGLLCKNILICENLESDDILAIRPIDIISKYIIIPDKDVTYLIPLNNVAEQ